MAVIEDKTTILHRYLLQDKLLYNPLHILVERNFINIYIRLYYTTEVISGINNDNKENLQTFAIFSVNRDYFARNHRECRLLDSNMKVSK